MLASSAWAVQILDVAFSRRICYSLVYIDIRNAGFPLESFEMPITRPGILRLYCSKVAK